MNPDLVRWVDRTMSVEEATKVSITINDCFFL